MSKKTEPIPSIDDRVKSANSGTKNTISTKIKKQPKIKRASMSPARAFGARALPTGPSELGLPATGSRALS